MSTAAIYVRISEDPEGRELGVQRQLKDCRDLARRLGVRVVAEFTENDTSASTRSKKARPQFKDMMHRAEAGEFGVILAYSNSRLTRRPAEWEQLIQMYEQHRVVIHTVASGSMDLSRADGRAVARTVAAWDAAEAERIAERVKRDVERRIDEGVFHGGGRAFGWRDAKTLDPDEHQVIKDAAKAVLAGASLRSVVADLNRRKVPTVTGAQWSIQSLKQILTNPRISGHRVHKGDIRGAAKWEPALDEATRLELVALLTDPSRKIGAQARRHLGPQLFRCGECDAKVFVSSGGTRRQYWCKGCRIYREAAAVDAYVSAVVIRMLEEYREDPLEADPEVVKTVEGLRAKIRATKIEFTNDDTLTPQDLREMLRHLQGRLTAEEAKLTAARKHQVLDGVTGEEAAEAWEMLPLDRRRSIVGALVEVRLYRSSGGRFDPATVEITAR